MPSSSSSIPPMPVLRNCKKGCVSPFPQSLNYHNRIHHQESVNVKSNGVEQTLHRDNDTRQFSCPLCTGYTTVDPDRFRQHFSSCKPPPSDKLLVNISNDDFYRLPDENTVTSIPGYNLLPFNIVVHTVLKAIICLQCHQPVLPPSALPRHVHSHLPSLLFPPTLVNTLVDNYQLGDKINYPLEAIDPIYGIPILEEPHIFCQQCNKGYQSLESLRSHQSHSHCTGHGLGYAQLIPGVSRRIIQVQLKSLVKKEGLNLDYTALIQQGSSSGHNYLKNPLPIVENESNLTAFFRTDGWLSHVQSYTPTDLYEARRTHEKNDNLGEAIRQAARRYLVQIQSQIEGNVHYGLLKNIATTTV